MSARLLSDRDWASIDGRVCLVTDFVPMAAFQAGRVVALPGTPYASVRLRCEKGPEELTGFVSHKIDFAMLWAAFRKRARVPGTNLEVDSAALNPEGLGENEEVWLVWTKRNYSSMMRLLSPFLPRLVIYVAPRGAFQLEMNTQIRPDLTGEARWKAVAPLATWKPAAMR
jgi:hypothetical protein